MVVMAVGVLHGSAIEATAADPQTEAAGMSAMSELDAELRGLHEPKRASFTVRLPRAEYDALQSLYYATVRDHRLSFNAWIARLISEGMTSAWYAADCPPAGVAR